MTAAAALYWLLTALGGGLVAGLVRADLHIEERLAVAVVTGVLGGALGALGFCTVWGMGVAAVLAGPSLLVVVAGVALRAVGDGLSPWRQSLSEVGERWHNGELVRIAVVAVAAVTGFAVLFAHTLFTADGAIQSNFATVWADWSAHATTASSFAVGHNLPPTNPVFSGTALLYPFLPDFQSAMLLSLGVGIAGALAMPGAVMCVAITVLVVSIARRLTGSIAVGVLAMAMCMLGGGLGIEGLYWDSCHNGGATSAQCEPSRFAHDPLGAISTAAHTVAHVPGSITTQARPYDNLEAPAGTEPLGNLQWYTPLLAWWLPQRPFLFGFAGVLCVFLLLLAARGDPRPQWGAFTVAGLVCGLLPLVHVHSFIALVVLLPCFAVMWRRVEWLSLGVVAVVLAAPRLIQLATGEHGAPALGNTFPWLEPGWMSQAIPNAAQLHQGFAPLAVAGAVGNGIRAVLTPQWWGFWVLNTGIVLPVMLIAGLLAAARWLPASSSRQPLGARFASALPSGLLQFCLPFLVIFALCNVVVFQSWEWDNTKLFAYWYFGASLLLGALVVRAWRSGWLPATLGTIGYVSVIMTGTVVMLRFLPWTPTSDSNAGPFTWASADERALAAQVERRTEPDAVILTLGRHNDSLMTLAGRHTVLGYIGWLWSYGIDYGARKSDVSVMYQGCTAGQRSCLATDLLRAYGVAYVEIAPRELSAVPNADAQWWSETFPAVAQAGGVTVYDVRAVSRP